MTITISANAARDLKWLAVNYYVVKGEKPMKLEDLIERLIDDAFDEANPPEYQTSGFDRQ